MSLPHIVTDAEREARKREAQGATLLTAAMLEEARRFVRVAKVDPTSQYVIVRRQDFERLRNALNPGRAQ